MKWAVVGMGRAGNARVKALQADTRVTSVLSSSRRDAASSFENILSSDVFGVALCRESERHFLDGMKILDAGKHLILEYPIAGSHAEAQRLLKRAEDMHRVCHVGHLGLLGEWHRDVRQWLDEQPIQSLTYWYDAGYGSGLARQVEAGSWGSVLLPRLQHVWAWFGPLKLLSVQREQDQDGYRCILEMGTTQGQRVTLRETRRTGLPRVRGLNGYDREGVSIPAPMWTRSSDIFKKDTAYALDRCLDARRVPPLVSKDALLGVRALADTIQAEWLR